MSRAQKATALCGGMGLFFVTLGELTPLHLSLAGLYVVGMASGIWIGEVMARPETGGSAKAGDSGKPSEAAGSGEAWVHTP